MAASTATNCACAEAAPVVVEISRVDLSPSPKACVVDVEEDVELEEDVLVLSEALLNVPAVKPRRPSASESVGPAINFAVTPELT